MKTLLAGLIGLNGFLNTGIVSFPMSNNTLSKAGAFVSTHDMIKERIIMQYGKVS